MISLIYSVERSYGRSYEQAATFGEQTKEVISPLKAPGLHKTKPSKAKAQKQYRDLNSFSNHCFFPFFNAGIFWDLASGCVKQESNFKDQLLPPRDRCRLANTIPSSQPPPAQGFAHLPQSIVPLPQECTTIPFDLSQKALTVQFQGPT